MINLKVPGDAVRVFEICRCRIKKQARTVDRRDAVVRECRYSKNLILFEGANIPRYLVVKEAKSAAYDSATGFSWRDHKTHTRREVVVLSDVVAIVTKSEVEHEMRVHDPLVLHKC